MLKGGSAASRSGSGAGAGARSRSSASTSALPSNSKEDKQPSIGSAPHEISGTGSEETDLSTSEEEDSSWISWFCGVRGNQFLCEIEEDYIQDDFNLCGLQAEVPNYDYALDMILDNESLSDEVGEEHVEVESDAELLYGLIHARFILTVKGLHAMNFYFSSIGLISVVIMSSLNHCIQTRNDQSSDFFVVKLTRSTLSHICEGYDDAQACLANLKNLGELDKTLIVRHVISW